jgi:hypothetical protein
MPGGLISLLLIVGRNGWAVTVFWETTQILAATWPDLCNAHLTRDDAGPGNALFAARPRGHTKDTTTYDRSFLTGSRDVSTSTQQVATQRQPADDLRHFLTAAAYSDTPRSM